MPRVAWRRGMMSRWWVWWRRRVSRKRIVDAMR